MVICLNSMCVCVMVCYLVYSRFRFICCVWLCVVVMCDEWLSRVARLVLMFVLYVLVRLVVLLWGKFVFRVSWGFGSRLVVNVCVCVRFSVLCLECRFGLFVMVSVVSLVMFSLLVGLK